MMVRVKNRFVNMAFHKERELEKKKEKWETSEQIKSRVQKANEERALRWNEQKLSSGRILGFRELFATTSFSKVLLLQV